MPKRDRSIPSRVALLAALLLFAGGCAASTGRWTRADYELSADQLRAESRTEPLSPRIYLIADNQRHELLGDGVRLFRTAVGDRHTPVAIRPPQLDLFGQDPAHGSLLPEDVELGPAVVLATPIPEPGTGFLLAIGLLGLGIGSKRRGSVTYGA